MYNKEAMRKLLEDCWDACIENTMRPHSDRYEKLPKHPDRDTYITSQLSAMEQVEGTKWVKASERLPEVSEGHAHEVIINSHINKAQEQDVVVCGIFYNGNFYICSEWNGEYPDDVEPIKKGRISHWQELPPPHSSSEFPSDGQDWISVEAKPKIVTLCGSTRFAQYFMIKRWELEKSGIITLGINILPDNYFAEGDSHGAEQDGVKEILDELHKRKIDLSDEVFILNVDGYIGDSTCSEIEYAIKIGKPVKYLESLPKPPSQ